MKAWAKNGLAAGFVAACSLHGTALAAAWTLDPTHTFVSFEVRLFDLSTQHGRFDRRQGTLDFDAEARQGRVDVSIATASVNTGVAAFDTLWRRLLDSERHPAARFVADRFAFDGEQLRAVDGELTLRGRTQPLKLTALRFGCYLNPLFQRRVCGGDFEATLLRSDWGLEGGSEIGLADSVRLLVQVEAISP